jgi:hypothetical protein
LRATLQFKSVDRLALRIVNESVLRFASLLLRS